MIKIKTDLVILDENIIKDKIYYIRGKKVMIDFELAEIYGYSTKSFNQQVQRNIERFDDDFRFMLTKEEYNYILRSQNVTSSLKNDNYGGRRYLPYAFTEEGIYMLMTVLKGDKAIKQSKSLIRLFKSMKDFLIENKILEQDYIKNMLLKHENRIDTLELSMEKIEEKKKENEIYFNGQVYDAYSKIIRLFKNAKNKIVIIDSYADIELLDIIKQLNVIIFLITTKKYIKQNILDKYNEQYHNLKIVYNNTFHDRYFIIDNDMYHCGASINRIGYKTFSITLLSDKEVCESLNDKVNNLLK